MASTLVSPKTAVLLVIVALSLTCSVTATRKSPQTHTLKETTMVFYMHDFETGPNVTVVPVAGIANKTTVFDFGTILTLDDALTESIERNSTQVGRARGIYANSAVDGSELHFMMSVVFTNKEYVGSTLEIQGSNRFLLKTREVSVVSGTGKFRMARGYVTLETVMLDLPNKNAILRWTLTVFHF